MDYGSWEIVVLLCLAFPQRLGPNGLSPDFLLILTESMRRPRFELLIGLFILLFLISILLREASSRSKGYIGNP
jgi:hypothetical protein